MPGSARRVSVSWRFGASRPTVPRAGRCSSRWTADAWLVAAIKQVPGRSSTHDSNPRAARLRPAVFGSPTGGLWLVLLVAAVFLSYPGPGRADELLARLAEPGTVLLLRHAMAPGTGDPPGFRPDDCATQRNLSDAGRAQARALGDRLREAGIT
jgi:hypothetical protein